MCMSHDICMSHDMSTSPASRMYQWAHPSLCKWAHPRLPPSLQKYSSRIQIHECKQTDTHVDVWWDRERPQWLDMTRCDRQEGTSMTYCPLAPDVFNSSISPPTILLPHAISLSSVCACVYVCVWVCVRVWIPIYHHGLPLFSCCTPTTIFSGFWMHRGQVSGRGGVMVCDANHSLELFRGLKMWWTWYCWLILKRVFI